MTAIVYEDPIYYIFFMRLCYVLGTFLNFFVVYVIYEKSPVSMHRYKHLLLWYQLWSIAFEVFLHGLEPQVFFPTLLVRTSGWLFTIFGMNVITAFEIGAVILFHMVFATAKCLLYRHRQILPIGHIFRVKIRTMAFFFAIHYIFCDVFFVHTLSLGNAELGNGLGIRDKILKRYPEYSFVLDHDDFFAGDASSIYPFTGLTLQMNACVIVAVSIAEAATFGFALVAHAFWMLDGHVALSRQTRRLQTKLMKGLLLQLAIPYLTLLLPWGLFAGVQFADYKISPAILNFAFWFNASHATMSSISILLFTEPYKMFVLRLFGWKKITRAVTTTSLSVSRI